MNDFLRKINLILSLLIIIAGLKAGGIAAFGCGVLGFTGGTVLKRKEELAEEASETMTETTAEQETLTGEDNNRQRRQVDVNKED